MWKLTKPKSVSAKMNKIGRNFSFNIVHCHGIMLTTVRHCTKLWALNNTYKICYTATKNSVHFHSILIKMGNW
jgi:hypothetical protein